MNKLLGSIVLCAGVFGTAIGYAQAAKPKTDVKKDTKTNWIEPKKDAKPELPPIHWAKVSLDFSAGTRGVGLGMRYRIGESSWGIRLGFSYLPLSYTSALPLSGYKTSIDLENNFTGVQLLAEFRPAPNSRFKLIGGFGYFPIAKLTCDLTPTGNYAYGLQTISSDQIGTVKATLDWSGIAPFVGFGFGSPHPRHKLGCSAGFGIYILPDPKVTVVGTKFLEGNYQNVPYLEENMKSYKYLPVLNFHVNYRFKSKETHGTK